MVKLILLKYKDIVLYLNKNQFYTNKLNSDQF
jgi:hypothetical protein